MLQRFGAGFWLVTIVTVIIVFSNLGGIPLLDPDEPVYGETPKEMLQFNEYISPRIYGDYWYDKPPMYYWLVALSYKLFGISEFAARFPSAFLAVICVLVVYLSGCKLFNDRTGMIGALVLATSIEYFYLGKAAVTDITLTLFLTVSLLGFIQKRYYLFYIGAALATVTKGPIGLLFPGAIAFCYLAATRNFSELRNMKIPSGIVLYVLIGLPWYLIMYKIHGNAFIDTFLGFHNVTRFTSPEHPEGVLWYYFIPVLIIGFFPWTALMLQSIWHSLVNSRDKFSVLLFLNIWAAFIFIFFTISQTKLVSYILPMYPPLAMIVGWYIGRLWDTQRNQGRPVTWLVCLAVITSLFVIGLVIGLKSMPILQNGVVVTAVVLIAMTLGVIYFGWKRQIDRVVWTQIIAMMIFAMVLVTVIFPVAAPNFTSINIANEFKSYYDGKSPVYIVKFLHPGFTFYTNMYGNELIAAHEISEIISKGERSYFVIRQLDYNTLAENDRQKLTILVTSADKMLLIHQ